MFHCEKTVFLQWLATLATGILLAVPIFEAKAQSSNQSITIHFGGTVNQIYGTGNGIPIGAMVNGSLTAIPANFALIAGNGSTTGASEFSDLNATISVTVNGTTTTFQGLQASVLNNTIDNSTFAVSADAFALSWGPNGADGISVYYPNTTVANSSLTSLLTMMNMGLSGALTYTDDATITVGADSTGMNGVSAPLSTFFAITNYPPAPALGVKLSGKNATLSWPTNAAGYQLQGSSFLGAGANWSAVTNAPAIAGTNYSLSLPVTNHSGFFRLQGTN